MSGLVNTSLPGTGGISLWNLGPTEVQQDERADHTMLISLENSLNFKTESLSINIGRIGRDWLLDLVDPVEINDQKVFLTDGDLTFSTTGLEFSNPRLGTSYPKGDLILGHAGGIEAITDVIPFLWEDKVLNAKYIGTSNIINISPHVLNDVVSDELINFK